MDDIAHSVNVVLPIESREMNAADYVACFEDAFLTNDGIDGDLRQGIRGMTSAMRKLRDGLAESAQPKWADMIKRISVISFPTYSIDPHIGKPPSGEGAFIFSDPWFGNCI